MEMETVYFLEAYAVLFGPTLIALALLGWVIFLIRTRDRLEAKNENQARVIRDQAREHWTLESDLDTLREENDVLRLLNESFLQVLPKRDKSGKFKKSSKESF